MTKKPTKSRKATPSNRKKPAAKSVPKAEPKLAAPATDMAPAVEAAVVTTTAPTLSTPAIKKKELVDQVVLRSGMKKKDVKPVVEATLAELGHALANDRELNLLPFAKLKIQKVKELSGARVTIARLRQPKPDKDAAE